MKRWIAIVGPQQVVLILTHHANTENYLEGTGRGRKEGSLG